jgi:hypothetical protein
VNDLISKSLRLALALAVSALCVAPASAATLSHAGLYEAEAEMEQDTQARRAAAFREAMGVVLVRLTGRLEAAGGEDTEEIRRNAERYVQQYRATGDGKLWVAFDADALNRAMAERGLPIWGAERPAVLLVLAVDEGAGERYVLSAEDEMPDPESKALRDRVQELAEFRGLPIILPLMDAQDRSVMSFTEAWGGFDQALVDAGARYGADSVLLGRLQSDQAFRARWTLYDEDQSYRWTGTIEDGIHGASDRFAQSYAVTTGAAVAGEIGLEVRGVDSLDDYGRVLAYLERLTAVSSVSVRRLQDDTVEFGMRLIGSLQNVDRAIRLGGVLRSEGPVTADPDAVDTVGGRPVMLSYRLVR